MYGLINRAIHDLVIKSADTGTWERIKARAGFEVETFLSMETYPDAVTVTLVVAAADELHTTPDALLERFGRHWVSYAAQHGYRDLMQARGDSLFAFISRLDDLHARLSLIFPKLRPPSFKAEEIDARTLRLHYISERDGLTPFVIGLMHGLGGLFGHEMDVKLERSRADGHAHDELLLRIV